MSERKYLTTLAYFEPSPSEMRELQREAADLHAVVDSKTSSWVDRTRSAERLKEVERKIQTGRAAARLEAQHHAAPPAAASASAPVQEFVPTRPYFEREQAQQAQHGSVAQVCPTLAEAQNAAGRYVLSDSNECYLWIPWDAGAVA